MSGIAWRDAAKYCVNALMIDNKIDACKKNSAVLDCCTYHIIQQKHCSMHIYKKCAKMIGAKENPHIFLH